MNGTNETFADCVCVPGAAGLIQANFQTPSYSGSCVPQACPANSNGTNIVSGCICNLGYVGRIVASTTDPFYTESCTAPFRVTRSFEFTGGDVSVTVPADVFMIRALVWGAGGNSGGTSSSTTCLTTLSGSCGSFVDTILSVTPGDTLTISVGGSSPYVAACGNCQPQVQGFFGSTGCQNQGGTGDSGGANGNSGGSGGGGSAIRKNGVDMIRAAGGAGGGGAGYPDLNGNSASGAESNGNGGAGRIPGFAGLASGSCGGSGGGGSGSSQNTGSGTSGNKGVSLLPTLNTQAQQFVPQFSPNAIFPFISDTVPAGSGFASLGFNAQTMAFGGTFPSLQGGNGFVVLYAAFPLI